MGSQTGSFTARFTMVADTSPVDAVVGLGAAAGSQYADFAVLVRMSAEGILDVRNGGQYAHDATVTYVAGEPYHVRVVVDVPARRYDVLVTASAGAEVSLASQYAFRTEQASVTSLTTWGTVVLGSGSFRVCDFSVTPVASGSSSGPPPASSSGRPDAGHDGDAGTGTGTPYGPNGLAWPSLTPAADAPATEVVADCPGVLAALGRAVAGSVIHVQAGSHGTCEVSSASLRSHLAGFAQNVLVRSAPGGVAQLSSLKSSVPNVTWAFMEVGTLNLEKGADRNRAARLKMGAESGIYLTAVDDVELVEVVANQRGHNNDRLHISPDYNGGQQAGRHIPRNLLVERCWLEGLDVDTVGPHSDTVQWLGMTGAVTFRNTFLGAAGNNATMQCGAEFQGSTPYASFLLDTVFLGGAAVFGNGNLFGCGATGTTYRDCEWDMNLKVTTRTGPVLEMTGCRVEPADPRFPDGRHVYDVFPENTYGVPVSPPTFVAPPWWW
jgi:hypothetical protein